MRLGSATRAGIRRPTTGLRGPDISQAAAGPFPGLDVTVQAVIAAGQATPNRIDGLTIEELDDGTTILRLDGSAKPTFNV